MENCRLLMRICPNAFVTCGVPMVHSMCLLKFHLYIYGDEPPKSMKLPRISLLLHRASFPYYDFFPLPHL